MGDLYELMRAAPATRAFTDVPVDHAVIARVLEHARFAPSGGNRQGWRVIVVSDAGTRRAMRDLYVPCWRDYMAAMNGPADGVSSGRRHALEAADRFAQDFDKVPVHLVICVVLEALAIVDGGLGRQSISGGASVYPFVQNVLLGLRNEGLGAAFTTLLSPAEPQLRELLAIPEGVAFAGDIAVGHRAGPWPTRLSRKPVEEFAFGERYGESW